MKVAFQDAAESDLEGIGDHIAERDPIRAISFVNDIRAHANRIGDFPESCPIMRRFGAHEIRRCVHGSYLIFYRIARARVEILQVIHGARRLQSK